MYHLVHTLFYLCLLVPAIESQSQSALESDPTGWTNPLADKSLRDWVRGPLAAAGQLRPGQMSDPSPWKLDSSGQILICEGDKVGHEWLRYAPELGNFLAHVEWRFIKVEGEPRYNSGVFVRTSADGAIWHQAQAGAAGGFLFGATPVNGVVQRVNLREKMTENRVKPAGEWNIYELRALGKQITLWVNGAVTSEFTNCEVPRGYFGVEAEGFRVEFRNIQVKPLP
jgi:hypothetical protein